MIKEYRLKNNLMARDLEKGLKINVKKIHALENKNSIKIKDFIKFWEFSKKDYKKLLELLHDNKIKVSSHGNVKSKIFLPLKLDGAYLSIFKNLRPYKTEVRLIKKDIGNIEEFIKIINSKLGTKVIEKRKGVYSICNIALVNYLKQFFEYSSHWNAISNKERSLLDKRLTSIFN